MHSRRTGRLFLSRKWGKPRTPVLTGRVCAGQKGCRLAKGHKEGIKASRRVTSAVGKTQSKLNVGQNVP